MLETKIKRGKESWDYIYVSLGFVLTIEAAIVAMAPLHWPYNVAVYILVSLLTSSVFLTNSWFQNKLIGFKSKIEDEFR